LKTLLRPSDFEHRTVRVDTLSMHVVVAGPEDGPLVLLLHGFEEFWYIWRYQIRALGQAGFRVVAPDQRGYNLTDKRGPYDPFTITRDAADLILIGLSSLDTTVHAPTRMIHGEPDGAFDRVTVEASRSWCPGLEIIYVSNTGHFVPQDAPEEVNRLILEFLHPARVQR
jgi:pimeloyl-ACP methyl ester carboxylesterase